MLLSSTPHLGLKTTDFTGMKVVEAVVRGALDPRKAVQPNRASTSASDLVPCRLHYQCGAGLRVHIYLAMAHDNCALNYDLALVPLCLLDRCGIDL